MIFRLDLRDDTMNRPIYWRSLPAMALALLVAFTSIGCAKEGDKEKEDSEQKEPARVDLPDPPPASGLEIQVKNDDGTFRVRGLTSNRGKHLGSEVEVKGVIASISPECDPSEAKKCDKPYMIIKDNPDADRPLKVVGHEDEFIDRADLEEGEEHVFKGTYKKIAAEFISSEYGLLLLDAVDDEKVMEE